jgi:hypothetical protein
MKILLTVLISLFLLTTPYASTERPGRGEIKEVCVDRTGRDGKPIVDKKGNPIKDCRKIRVRKKLDGTEFPPNRN